MSALPPKADMCGGMSAWANSGHDEITASERGVSLNAAFCGTSNEVSHDCTRHSVGILPTSDTDSANGHHLCLPHTRETHGPLSAVDRI